MTDSKLEIKVGSITFSGEGDSDWLSKQLDKVLAKIPEQPPTAPPDATKNDADNGGSELHSATATARTPTGTLAAYLRSTNSTSNQVRKFLATATWLHDAEGKNRVATKDVSNALSSHSQGKLTNPAECLNKNAGKGHCVKEGGAFYVSPEGREFLSK